MAMSIAQRRYNKRVIILSLIYSVALVGAVYGFQHHLLNGPVAYLAAILPALPIIGIFAAMGLYLVEEQDEYVRMLRVRQILVATGFALSLTTLWGFLEILADAPHIPLFYVTVLWLAGLGAGACWNRLRA